MSNKLTKIEPDKINFLKELKDGSVVFTCAKAEIEFPESFIDHKIAEIVGKDGITTRNFWRVVNLFVTNDVSLIIFVPLTIIMFRAGGKEKYILPVLTFENRYSPKKPSVQAFLMPAQTACFISGNG